MKNNQFSPMTEKEMMEVNGGGLLDGIPILGPLLSPILTLLQQLLASLGLPINLPV
ncbi:MAG: bacteriocin [Niastella sp.]|nr:bacteriocin [Niastella sp.]